MKLFGQYLKSLRESELGLSARGLSDALSKLGVVASHASILRYESGERPAPFDYLASLAGLVGHPIELPFPHQTVVLESRSHLAPRSSGSDQASAPGPGSSLGERIRWIMSTRNPSPEQDVFLEADWARELGLSRKLLRSVMSDEWEPDAYSLEHLADIADVSLQWLETGEGDPFTSEQPTSEVTAEDSRALSDAERIYLLQLLTGSLKAIGTAEEKGDTYVLNRARMCLFEAIHVLKLRGDGGAGSLR